MKLPENFRNCLSECAITAFSDSFINIDFTFTNHMKNDATFEKKEEELSSIIDKLEVHDFRSHALELEVQFQIPDFGTCGC